MAKHRIELVEFGCAPFQDFNAHACGFGDIGKIMFLRRQKLVERRIKQADSDRKPGHDFKDPFEVRPLFGEQLCKRRPPARLVLGKDHLADSSDPRGIEEHMLGAAQPDPFGTKIARYAAIGRGFGIGTHLHPPRGIGPDHQRSKIARQFRLDRCDLPEHDFAR